LDAFTGAPVWIGGNSSMSGATKLVAGMNFSIAGDVLTLDRNFDGLADRVYAVDVGGNVWRVDIDDISVSNWKVWKIASLADRSATASTRKFLFGADVVPGAAFDSVFVGSGDRSIHCKATSRKPW